MTGKLLLLTLAAAAVIGIFAWNVLPRAPLPPTVPSEDADRRGPTVPTATFLDPVRGDRNAKNTIIEFGDFECPYCATANETLNGYLRTHADVRLVWKDFPLPTHPNALAAAEAARCAGDQGKYWEYHDLLMENQHRLGTPFYGEAATELRLDQAAFVACQDQHLHAARIQASFDEGAAAGVDGIPYFFVNGKKFSGAITSAELDNALNAK